MQETPVDSWVRKIPWRRDRLPTPVFLGFPCVSSSVSCKGQVSGGISERSGMMDAKSPAHSRSLVLQSCYNTSSPRSGGWTSEIKVWAGPCSPQRLWGRGRKMLPTSSSSGPQSSLSCSSHLFADPEHCNVRFPYSGVFPVPHHYSRNIKACKALLPPWSHLTYR